ncbi:MAG TPA: hypothetical protein VMX94_02280 [Armatimonadota bacterium]|nr:hypothetical protein [Armatimonadota bacterium]
MEKNKVVTCEAHEPSQDSLFWLEVGREMIKASTGIANDVAKQLVTLNTALISAYLVAAKLLGIVTLGQGLKRLIFAIPVGLWLLSISLGVFVLVPRQDEVSSISPTDIKAARKRAIGSKCVFVWLAVAALTSGILFVTLILLYMPLMPEGD